MGLADGDVDADYVDGGEGDGWWMVIAGSSKFRSCKPVNCQVNSAGPFLVASVLGKLPGPYDACWCQCALSRVGRLPGPYAY